MRYTLRQLEVFVATAHYENISKAANALAMSQSAASGALKDLESQFNVQLFDRVGKRLQTNEFGQRIRTSAEALLAQARALEQDLSQHTSIGHLRVGATLTIGNYLCVEMITEYMGASRDARVELDVANTESICQKLLNFDIDLGLIEGELHHPDLRVIPWREDEMQCFCAPHHPLAGLNTVDDDTLLATPWILREQGSGTRQAFDRAMAGMAPALNVRLELQHTEAIKRAVEKGIGISCLSTITLQDAFQRGTLVPLTLPNKHFKRLFYFVIHRQKYLAAGLLRWMEICGLDTKALDTPS